MSFTGRGVRSALLLATVALACAGCGVGTTVEATTTQPTATPGTAPAGGTAPAPNLPGPGHSRLVTAQTGALNPRPVSWAQAQTLAGNTVRLYFWSGACDQVDHVAAAWTATTVTLTLYVGGDRKDAGRACPDYAAATAVDTTLRQPLGGRQLLDGSATGADSGHRPVIT
jgi:hypothetical protein